MPITDEQVKNLKGLTQEQAGQVLGAEGPNELPSAKKRSVFKIIFDVFKEPMFLLLVAIGVIYLFLGDIQEALMLLGFVFVIMGITIYQEGKTERTLDALRDLSSPRALVIRDGERVRIPGREVVRGDFVVLCEGDRIPADGTLVWAVNLTVDESLLTGESVAVRKSAGEGAEEMDKPGGDDLPSVFSGTLVVHGRGVAQIKATGAKSEIGKIGKALLAVQPEETRLQRETKSIVKTFFVVALVFFAAIVVVYGLTRRDWLNGLLTGLTMAMAMLPEEFPVVLTIFLALGAWRISQKKVLARKMAAVEMLGAATVLCSDKTGTLTQNRMKIQKLYSRGRFHDVGGKGGPPLPEDFHELLEYGILASQEDPFDPMEKAIQEVGVESLSDTEHLHKNWILVQQYPLSRKLLALSHVWESAESGGYVVAAKGAPEAVADLCHLDEEKARELMSAVQEMAAEGLRVLGVAKSVFEKGKLPDLQHDFPFELIGLLGLEDPIRPAVPRAIEECSNAGIKVIMITGDFPMTAQKIGKQIGLPNADVVITGPDLERMSGQELQERIKDAGIFARVVPEQKLLIIDALKANGEVVAMTGDGVNDAPALKSAHIGVAMGGRGTDVAREASDLVLLDDDFSSIVAAVRMGRRIFDNLKNAMAYIISVHVPIALASLLPVLLQWSEMLLYPVHVVFLELLIDPACSVVFEAEEADPNIMRRRPRSPKERLFSRKSLAISAMQGIVAFAIVFGVYSISLGIGQSQAEARALAFCTLIVSNLCMILTNRSWTRSIVASFKVPNRALLWVVLGGLGFLTLINLIPWLRNLFHFAPMHAIDILISLAAGGVSVLWFEVLKVFIRRRRKGE